MTEDIEELRRKIRRLRELRERGEISDDAYRRLLAEYQKKLRDLSERKPAYEKPPVKQHRSLATMLIIATIIAGIAFTLGYSAKAPETRTVSITYHYTRTVTVVKTITLTRTKTVIVTIPNTLTKTVILAPTKTVTVTTVTVHKTITVKPSIKIRIDGDCSDWRGISPIITEPERDLSRDNYALGVADIKEVFLTDDGRNLCFLVRFWNPVNFNLHPKRGEILTSIYVDIYVGGQEMPLLRVYIHSLWGKLKKYVGADFDKDGDYEEESDRVSEVKLAYKDNDVEFSIPIALINEVAEKFVGTLTNKVELSIYSWAWRRTDGGYGGKLDWLRKVTYELS